MLSEQHAQIRRRSRRVVLPIPTMTDDYATFLARKQTLPIQTGLATIPDLNPALFPFQHAALTYLLTIGRGAAFLSTGLGKTLLQLDWARVVATHMQRPVLILAPLAVAAQTVREGARRNVRTARTSSMPHARAVAARARRPRGSCRTRRATGRGSSPVARICRSGHVATAVGRRRAGEASS
jgi:hypothetical protein